MLLNKSDANGQQALKTGFWRVSAKGADGKHSICEEVLTAPTHMYYTFRNKISRVYTKDGKTCNKPPVNATASYIGWDPNTATLSFRAQAVPGHSVRKDGVFLISCETVLSSASVESETQDDRDRLVSADEDDDENDGGDDEDEGEEDDDKDEEEQPPSKKQKLKVQNLTTPQEKMETLKDLARIMAFVTGCSKESFDELSADYAFVR